MLSDTLRYINLAEVAIGLVALRGPMHLCASVSEERRDGEGVDSEWIFFALRFCFHCTQLHCRILTLCSPRHSVLTREFAYSSPKRIHFQMEL